MVFFFKNLLITLFLLGVIEVCSSFFINDSRYNQIYSVLEASPNYMWRVRGGIHRDFFGANLSTNHSGFRVPENVNRDCHKKIGIFGASPSFGWGVPEVETYISRLNQIFENQGVCFINYSVIGFSSSQGVRLFKEVLEQEKLDSVIVSYLVNDIDFNRFYFSGPQTDREVLKDISFFKPRFWMEKLKDTSSYKLLRQILVEGKKTKDFQKSIVKTVSYTRVTSSEFIENIDSMLKWAIEKEVNFFYLEMPVGIHVMAKYIEKLCHLKHIESDIELAKKKVEQCQLQDDSEIFARRTSSSIDQVRSVIAMRRFNHDRMILREKMDNTRIIKIRELGMKDLAKSFLSSDRDYVHPSSYGHRIIAEDISKFLEAIYK